MINIDKPYIIGETAFHHEGDKEFLLNLVKASQNLDINAIKFHLTLDLDDYMTADNEVIEIVRPWCLKADAWDEIIGTVEHMDVVILCNDVKAVDYVLAKKDNKIKLIEIHATGINDIFLLDKAALFSGTVILGTGGSTLDQIQFAIERLNKAGKHDILLMHGFQNYPTDYKDIKLNRMKKLNDLFGYPVGYADHTDPMDELNEVVSCIGVANGFNVLEKHFTTHFGDKRIDSQSAISLDQMKRVVTIANTMYQIYDAKNSLELSESELKYGNIGPMKKAIVAREDIKSGEVIAVDKIAYKRTNGSSNLNQNDINKILGNKASEDISKDEIISFSNVEYEFKLPDTSQFKNTSK